MWFRLILLIPEISRGIATTGLVSRRVIGDWVIEKLKNSIT
jgi:hypothetical protein